MATGPAAKARLTRRALLIGAGATVGLGLGFAVWPREETVNLVAGEGETILSGWLKIGSDGRVTVIVPQAEMGQGVFTGLPQILADELGADWESIAVEPAPLNPLYANRLLLDGSADGLPEALRGMGRWALREIATRSDMQVTAGSSSVRAFAEPMRLAGAAARVMLCKAAAARWDVDWRDCDTANGEVVYQANRIAFEDVVAEAADQTVPDELPLRAPTLPEGRRPLLGQPVPRLDVPDKTAGRARFGADVRLPGMVYASIRHGPPGGGRLAGADRDALKGEKGIAGIVERERWIAVAADTWWQAERAAGRLVPRFEAAADMPSDEAIAKALADALEHGDAQVIARTGAGEAKGGTSVTADYRVPYAAHGALETLTATARVADGRAEIWAPTQSVTLARNSAAAALGLAESAVTVFPTFLGGSFGRKLETDACAEAAVIARELGKPVQLVWSREEEMRHDRYRPAAAARMRARLGQDGRILEWRARVAAPSVAQAAMTRSGDGGSAWLGGLGAELTDAYGRGATEGAYPLPYAADTFSVEHVPVGLPVEIGFWRSNAHSYTAFANECFVDELADAAGADPLDFRLKLLRADPRLANVLRTAAERGGYGQSETAQGLAVHACFGSAVAMVADVEIAAGGEIAVRRILCAADCGRIINPGLVRQQIEGGILFGLQAALYGGVRFAGGEVAPRNFDPGRTLRLGTAPRVEVILLPSDAPPGGVGEIAVPPVAPAVANAIFVASGVRQRALPLVQASAGAPAGKGRG